MKKLIAILSMFVLLAGINLNAMAANDDEESETKSNATMTTSMKGQVVDQHTGEALTGVRIEVEDADLETYTDFEGNFSLQGLKPGAYEVNVSYISYEDKSFENLKLELKADNNFTLEMKSID